jgi:hypothetical protein
MWPPRTEVTLIAFIGPILSEMQLACGILDLQMGAVMEVQRPVERKLRSANLLVTSEIMAGLSATDVIETAKRWRADCVFMGAEKMGFFERVFCDDFVASFAARAECSVEVVRGPLRRGAEISQSPAGARHKNSLPVAS